VTAANGGSHPATGPDRVRFRPVLGAEWVKFRTVRGWMISLVVAVGVSVVFTFLVANGTHTGTCTGTGSNCQSGHLYVPTGPDGEAVADSYQYLSQSLTGNGTITAQVASFTGLTSTNPVNVAPSLSATGPGLAGWAKAGILLTPTTRQGSPYAAIMATGDHGVRFQYDYIHDQPGQPAAITGTSPRWVRLTRSEATITGYDSTDGKSWHQIGTAHLSGLPTTVEVGLFVTSPISFRGQTGYPTQATGTFNHVTVAGATSGSWQSRSVGMSQADFYPTLGTGTGTSQPSHDGFVLTGSGDIAPAIIQGLFGTNTASSTLLLGLIVGLIVLIVIAAMFITAEYRGGLIRTTLAATPQRDRVLAAKATVIGGIGFVIGAIAAAIAVPVGEHLLTGNGAYLFPATAADLARIVLGCGLVTAFTAVAALALGTILRRSAGAVTAGIVVFVLPYVIGSSLSGTAETWLFRLTPAAAFAVLGVLPRSVLVDYPYTFANGYYPLSAWAGLLVLATYTAAAVCVARFRLGRRDA
jgi:ABC-type transport system involved in multi-copper enzyme maturation permease subunit